MRSLKVKRVESTSGGSVEANVLLPLGTTAERPGQPAVGTLRFNTTLSALEVYTTAGWAGLSPQSPALHVTSLLSGGTTAAQPLRVDVEALQAAGGFLTRVRYVEGAFFGSGTADDPLRLNVAAIPVSGGGIASVNRDDSLVGNGTSSSPLGVNRSAVGSVLDSFVPVLVTSSRSLAAGDAGCHLVVPVAGVLLLVPTSGFPFSDGQMVRVTNRASGGDPVRLEGVEFRLPSGAVETVYLLAAGETVLLVAEGGKLRVLAPGPQALARMPLSTFSSNRTVQAEDAGSVLVATGSASAVTLTVPSPIPFLNGQQVWVYNRLSGTNALLTLTGVQHTTPFGVSTQLSLRPGQSVWLYARAGHLHAHLHSGPQLFRPVSLTASRNLAAADAFCHLIYSGTGSITLTLPSAFPFRRGDVLFVSALSGAVSFSVPAEHPPLMNLDGVSACKTFTIGISEASDLYTSREVHIPFTSRVQTVMLVSDGERLFSI